jgi:hypothetical protein
MSADRLVRSMSAPFFRQVDKNRWAVQDQLLNDIGMVRRNGGRHYQARVGADEWHGQFKSRREAGLHVFQSNRVAIYHK